MEHLSFLLLVFSGTLFTYKEVEGLKVEKIVGGQEPDGKQQKYTVAVMLKPDEGNIPDQLVCAGAVLDDFYVTAIADCFYNPSGKLLNKHFYIMASVSDVYIPIFSTIYRTVDLLIIPKEYNPNATDPYSSPGNLAVIKLSKPLGLHRAHRYLRKLKVSHDVTIRANQAYDVSGFGWTKAPTSEELRSFLMNHQDPERSVGKLRVETAYISDLRTCYNDIGAPVAQGNMCVRIQQLEHEKKGICRADSGAPLVFKFHLKGLAISGFPECNENKKPAIYLNVGLYHIFISIAMSEDRDRSLMHIFELKNKNGVFQFAEQ